MRALLASLLLAATPAFAVAEFARPANTPMRGTEWVLDTLGGAPLPAARPITLTLGRDGRLSGSSGCNRYNVPFDTKAGVLKLSGPAAGTMMACPPDAMAAERRFLDRLQAGGRIRVTNRGQLSITSDGQPDLLFNGPKTVAAPR